MKGLNKNVFFKIVVISIIALVLMIPAFRIEKLIHERECTYRSAIAEVNGKWGAHQTVSGPIVTIPYYRYERPKYGRNTDQKLIQIMDYAHFLPDQLQIEGQIDPEQRYRGIHEVVVYKAKMTISGQFMTFNFEDFNINESDILYDKAYISIGITDLRGIEKQITLNWNNDEIDFNTGTRGKEVISEGIYSRLSIDRTKGKSYSFSFDLDIKGSQELNFVPVGKESKIHLKSTWNNPSFIGSFLPDNREITKLGFDANWEILDLNRNYPQTWIGKNHSLEDSSFGVDLLVPVDSYQKSIRSIKYALLFISLTFLAFFFVEILKKVFMHPIQYILVGIALILFYTLLLSFSEHMNYNLSFIISTFSTIMLIGGYVKAILKSIHLAMLISSILFVLYGFIFVVIQLQDYSLLIGSIGLFIILGVVMFLSRKIDWYEIGLRSE